MKEEDDDENEDEEKRLVKKDKSFIYILVSHHLFAFEKIF